MAAEAAVVSSWRLETTSSQLQAERLDAAASQLQNERLDTTSSHQRTESFKQAIDALIRAQNRFKQEFEEQWTALQKAMLPLQLEFEGICEQNRLHGPEHLLAMPGSAENLPPSEVLEIKNGDASVKATSSRLSKSATLSLTEGTQDEYRAFEEAEQEEAFETHEEIEPGPKWRAFLQSAHFDIMVGVVIIVNMVEIMLRIQYEGLLQQPGTTRSRTHEVEIVLEVAEHVFTTIFLLELMLRLLANGFSYLCSVANGIDALIVVLGCLDSWVLPSLNAQKTSLSMLRIFRLLRLMKVLRVVRIMKEFAPLRVLVQAVMSSVGALAWSLTLLFVLEIIGAILLAQSLQTIIQDEAKDLQLREKLWNSSGTMARAWLTLFEITMAPGSFVNHRYLFDEVNVGFTFAIAAYVCFVTFAVIRVITALFLKETLAASDRDLKQEQARIKMHRLAYSQRLCAHLEKSEGETAGQGRIDKEGLMYLLGFQRMTEWLQDAGLGVKDIERLFKALDLGDGTVLLSEVLACISQICDQTKDRDAILHAETAKLLEIANVLKQELSTGTVAV